MSLEGGKVFCYGEDGKIEKILQPNEKIFTIGYYVSCDVIHEHPGVKGIHCEIACDSFGRITVKNYCEDRPIIVNGETVAGTRPLLPGSTIEVVGKQFRWEYEHPSEKEHLTQTTPDAKAIKVQPAPNSEPGAPFFRAVQKRLTVHSFAYGLNSDREEDTENPYQCTIIQPLEMNTNREIENQSSANSIDIASNNENCTSKRSLSTCNHSDLVFTSYSPRTGINTPKGFACITPAKKTPISLYGTPRSALSEFNHSTNSRSFTTPKGDSSKVATTSMYLIDLITPLKPSKTPLKRTPLLKSALKNSAKSAVEDKRKIPLLSGSSGTNIQRRKIALDIGVKRKVVTATPKKSEQEQNAEGESNVSLLDSITEQSTINSDLGFCNDSSVIEISSDGTPSRLEGKKQLKTPQRAPPKAFSSSVRKAKSTEKEFAKNLKNNIELISKNLPIISNIGNIKNRRSSLPAASTVVGRQNALSQSTTGKLFKPTTTPKRILTTSTPFRSQKSNPKMVQSTTLKTSNLTESFMRHFCISSNQTTPKVATKTPQKSIIKNETKTPNKDNGSVLSIDMFDKSVNQIRENEKDRLNSTFTVDEEEELSDENKNGSRNNKSEILELQPLEKIGDFAKSDCLKEENEHIQPIVDEEIQGMDIPGRTNVSKTSKTCDNKNRLDKVSDNEEIQSSKISSNPSIACFTIESQKKVQTPNTVYTDLKGLKDILETPRCLNRTPIKTIFKTPNLEESGNKKECVSKSLIKTPVNTPKALAAKQLFIIPKVTKEENVYVREIVSAPSIVKGSQTNFVDIAGIKTLEESPQKNGLKSADKTSTELQTLDVLEDNKSFTKIFHDKYLDNPSTSAIERESAEPKCDIKTPKKKPIGMEDYTELQELENSDVSNTSVVAIRRPSTFNIETPTKLKSLEEISVNTEIQNTLVSTEHDSIQRKLRRSAAYKITTATNLHIPQNTISSKNADAVQRSENSENANILSTPASGLEFGQRKLGRCSHTKTKTPKNVQTPNKLISLKDKNDKDAEFPKNTNIPSTDLQIKDVAEKPLFPNTPVTRHEPIQSKLQRSNTFDVEKTKIPTHLLNSTTPDYGGAEENEDISVEKSEIQTDAFIEHSGTKGVLAAFKPVLGIIRKTISSKIRTMTSLPSPEKPLVLEDDVEVERTIISKNVEISTVCGQVQRSFTSEAGTPVQDLKTSIVLKYDTEAQCPQNIENANMQSTPQSSENSLALKCNTETHNGEISERPNITRTEVTPINIPKRHSFMVIGQKICATKRIKSMKESRRHTMGPLEKQYLSGPTNDDNLLKTDLVAFSKILNVVGKPVLSNDNLKLENNAEDKDKSSSNLNENIESSDLATKGKTPKAEPRKLVKSATFIIDSRKKPSICNSSSQKEITDSGFASTLSENVKHSKQLLKAPEEVNQTSDLKESPKLPKTPQTPRPPGLKEVFSTPKSSEDMNVVEIKELIETPKVARDFDDKYHSLNELLKTPKDSIKHNESANKSFKYGESCELGDNETLLIEDESYTPSTKSLQAEDVKNLQVKHEGVLERKYRSYPTTPTVELKSSSTKLQKSMNFFMDTEKESVNTSMTEFDQDQMEKSEFSNTEMYSCTSTPVVGLKNNLSRTRKSAVFYKEMEEDVCSSENLKTPIEECLQDELEEHESSDNTIDVTSREYLLKTPNCINTSPKSQKEGNIFGVKETLGETADSKKTSLLVGVKKLNSPKDQSSVNIRELGLKNLIKTPIETSKHVSNKELFYTPKSEEEDNFIGVKELMHEPKNLDQTVVMLGVKELLNTPKNETSNEIRELGLKTLLKTPAQTPKPVRIKELFYSPKPETKENLMGVKELMHEPKNLDQTVVMLGVKELLNTPKNEAFSEIRELGLKTLMKTPAQTPKPVRIKELFYSPKPEKEENLVGVKELMYTPKNLDQTTILVGIKELVKTPKEVKSPIPLGIKEMFNSSRTEKEASLGDIKEIIKTPESLKYADINVTGVDELLETTKSDANTEDFLKEPEIFSTPHLRQINKKDEDHMKTLTVEFPDQRETSVSPKNLSPQKQMSDLAFKTPSAKMVMVLETPQSVNINTTKLVSSAGPPPLYDLKENMEDIEEVFPTAVIDEENDTLSAEESFDKLVGKSIVRKSYGRSRISQKNSSFEAQFNKEQEIELAKWGENTVLTLSSEEIDENSRDVSDNAASFSMSGIKTLERDEELEEMEILQISQDEGVSNKGKIVTDLNPIQIASPETSTLKKTENKNVGKEMEYQKDDASENREENSQIDTNVVRNDSVEYVEESLIIEDKDEETNIISSNIVLEVEFATNTRAKSHSLRTRSKSLEKQKLEKNIIEEQLEIAASSEELMQAPDLTKTEFKKDLEEHDDDETKNLSVSVKADGRTSIVNEACITELEMQKRKSDSECGEAAVPAKRMLRKRRADNNLDETQPGTSSTESEAPLPPVRRGRPRRKADTVEPQEQISDSKLKSTSSRRGKRRKVEDVVDTQSDIAVLTPPQKGRARRKVEDVVDTQPDIAVLTPPQKGRARRKGEDVVDTQPDIAVLTPPQKGRARRKGEDVVDTQSDIAVLTPPQKGRARRKGEDVVDTQPDIAVLTPPQKGRARRKGEDVVDTQSDIAVLTPPQKGRARRKVEDVVDTQPDIAVLTPPQKGRARRKGEDVVDTQSDIAVLTPPQKGRARRKAEDVVDTQPDIAVLTPPQKGRARRKVEDVVDTQPDIAVLTPPQKGRARRKGEDVVETQPDIAVLTPPPKGRARRKVEDVVDTQPDVAVLTPPKKGRAKRKVEKPKPEKAKTSADEVTQIKPAILRNLSKEKQNVLTPKTEPNDGLEFKTPVSAAPRARRVLRSNSTSAQVSTPTLQQNQQEVNVINDSVDKIENSPPGAASTRTRGGIRFDPTIIEVKTTLSALPASGERGRPKINPPKEEVHLLNELKTSENGISASTSGRTRVSKRVKSTKDEVKIADVNVDQPETSRKARGRKKADITKEEAKALDVELESTAAISTRTRGRKRINSTKEEVQIVSEVKEHSESEEKIPSSVATSGRTRTRRNVDSAKN